MTIPNTFSSGTAADADEVNANFTHQEVHRKIFTQSTEFSTSNASFQNVTNGSFTISANGGMIIGFRFKAKLKTSTNNDSVEVGLKITGTNLGTLYLRPLGAVKSSTIDNNLVSGFDTAEGYILRHNTTDYTIKTAISPDPLELEDDTTTFQILLRRGATDETVYVDDMEVQVIYVPGFTED